LLITAIKLEDSENLIITLHKHNIVVDPPRLWLLSNLL